MGRSPSGAGLLDGSSSVSLTTVVRVALLGRTKTKSTRPQMSCFSPKKKKKSKKNVLHVLRCSVFLPKLLEKQWRSENF